MIREEHLKAIERGVDITEKWYCICGFINNLEDIEVESCKIKIGEMEWDDEGMHPIYACKDKENVWFVRDEINNIDIQYQVQNMYIHGNDYTLKINKTIDKLHERFISKYEEYEEYWGYIHCQFFNGKIKL